MDHIDIERIAQAVVREYGLPLRIASLVVDRSGDYLVRFADRYAPPAAAPVGIRCSVSASPYAVRESLKRGLDVND